MSRTLGNSTSVRTRGSALLSFRPRGEKQQQKHCCMLARMQSTLYTLVRIIAEFYSLSWWFFIFPKLTLFFYLYFNLLLLLFFFFSLASFSPLLRSFPTKAQTQCITPVLSGIYLKIPSCLSLPLSLWLAVTGSPSTILAPRASSPYILFKKSTVHSLQTVRQNLDRSSCFNQIPLLSRSGMEA